MCINVNTFVYERERERNGGRERQREGGLGGFGWSKLYARGLSQNTDHFFSSLIIPSSN